MVNLVFSKRQSNRNVTKLVGIVGGRGWGAIFEGRWKGRAEIFTFFPYLIEIDIL